MRPSRDAWDQFCDEVGHLREAGKFSDDQLDQLGLEAERLYEAGLLSEDHLLRLSHALLSPEDFALIDGIAYGLARLINTPLGQLAAEAGVPRTSSDWMTGDEVSRTIAHAAAKLADTPLDRLAAEAQQHRSRRHL